MTSPTRWPSPPAERRTPHDDRDLARTFPGSVGGSPTERITALLTAEVISGSDLVIDLHSAGADYAMPLFVGCVGGDDPVAERAVAATTAFAAPLSWRHDRIEPGRSVSVALDLGIPAIYVEGAGGRGAAPARAAGVRRRRRSGARLARDAGRRRHAGAGADHVDQRRRRQHRRLGDGTGRRVVFVTAVEAGDRVEAGQVVAEILDGEGRVAATIEAPRASTVMFLRRHAEIDAGQGVAMFGPVTD